MEELDMDKDDNFPPMVNDFHPGQGAMAPPQIEQMAPRELPQPVPMSLQSSSESGQDSTIREIRSDDFSISITQAKIVTPESTGGYFSYISPMTQSYAVFTIETKSKIELYESQNKLHKVLRRFSDFEYLLKQFQENPMYKNECFPTLPEKRYLGNLDDAFIEKRRVELEGFLRVLVQMEPRIKKDPNLFYFLTLEEEKFKDFKQNPHPFTDKIWSLFNQLPSQ